MQAINQLGSSLALRDQIKTNLAAFTPQLVAPNAKLKSAAVAITVFYDEQDRLAGHSEPSQAAVILTKRSVGLNSHSGQWALPGGRLDSGETETQAALRETAEEINLHLDHSSVLGRLDDYVTRSGYRISPIVLWTQCKLTDLKPNPDEVASIHAVSFSELSRPDQPNLEDIVESNRQVLSMNYLSDRIYSPTAALLYQFREVCLFGRATRVAHFDQPVFAWK